jgi:hypothetical protein
MLKYVIITTLAFLLFFSGILFTDEGPTINGIFPREIKPGIEAQVEISVRKSTISGFGSLTLELPEGINIVKHDDQGATYIFGDRKATWEWSSLPDGELITIRFTIIADGSLKGTKAISGYFLYTENSEKKSVNMDTAEFEVLAPATEPIASDSAKKSASPDITFIRSYERSATQLTVNLVIKKGYTKGFGRYSDEVPDNVMVKALLTDGGSFSVADKRLKFVWVNVPDKPELIISYVMICSATPTVKLDGEYAYLDRNQTHKYKLPAEIITLRQVNTTQPAVEIATNSSNNNSSSVTPVTVQPVTETTTAAPIKTVAVTSKPVDTAKTKVANVNETVKSIEPVKNAEPLKTANGAAYFSVQLGAFTNPNMNIALLKKKFHLTSDLRNEMQDGLNKFMTGKFTEYKLARDKRETIKAKNGISGAFVTAYNAGKRITVQEALMINHQKWFR